MIPYFPDILRAIISTTANVLLMMLFLKPKYSKKVTYLTVFSIWAVDLGVAVFCYMSGNLTLLSKIDVILFALLCFIIRPLFKDTFMQWLFSYLTVQNISDMVIILSFILSRYLPYPVYANSLLRLILFSFFLWLIARYIRPLYRQAVEHWTAYFAVALGLYVTFGYYVLSADDVILMLNQEAIPLTLIIFIGLAAYGSIFISLKNLQREFLIKEENQRMQAEKDYMQLATGNMEQRLMLMAEVAEQQRRGAHDRRHLNNVILELLEKDKKNEVMDLIKSQNQVMVSRDKIYCENLLVNAAVSHYVRLAEQKRIQVQVSLDIPQVIHVDALELSMVVSNLMENAIQACEKKGDMKKTYILFRSQMVGRLALEMENSCLKEVTLDENNQPATALEGHGTGSKSVMAFVNKYDGEIIYHVNEGVFRVRLLI